MTVISTTKQIISTDSIAVVRNPPTTNNMGASINLITYLIQDQREHERHETGQRDRSYQSRYFIGCEFHRIISISNQAIVHSIFYHRKYHLQTIWIFIHKSLQTFTVGKSFLSTTIPKPAAPDLAAYLVYRLNPKVNPLVFRCAVYPEQPILVVFNYQWFDHIGPLILNRR
jgi:hypothetical protein